MQQEMMPGVPVVMACRQTEMLSLPRFMTKGLRFYIVRDDNGDFIFLVMSTLESAVQAARAEESKKLTALLRDEMDGVRRMQESIIPKGLVPPPGYAITARYEPAQVQVVGVGVVPEQFAVPGELLDAPAAAAEGVERSDLKTFFYEMSQQRAQFAGDLQSLVRELGGEPATGGSIAGAVPRLSG